MQTFTPRCTLPAENKVFVNGTSVRSTLDIVWSNISLLVLCTWTIQHLNVPPQTIPTTIREKHYRTLYLGFRKAKWMLLTLLAPEIIMGMAFAERLSASDMLKLFTTEARRDGSATEPIPWSLGHSFFADMGGFAVTFTPEEINPVGAGAIPQTNVTATTQKLRRMLETLAYSSRYHSIDKICADSTATSMGLAFWKQDPINRSIVEQALRVVREDDLNHKGELEFYYNLACLQGATWILDGQQLLLARQLDIIKSLPNQTLAEIADRSKSDALIKLISGLQILWLVFQLCIRRHKGIAVSQLEVITLAFAVCALIVFLLLLNKPKDAGVPIYTKASRYATAEEMVRIAAQGPFPYAWSRGVWMPDNAFHYQGQTWVYFRRFLIGAGFGATLFGAFHFIAWNFVFPTRIERLLWQVSAIITIAAPFISIIVNGFFYWKCYRTSQNTYWWIFVRILLLPYVGARLYILVEMFRSLYFLPPEVYISTWASSIPYVS